MGIHTCLDLYSDNIRHAVVLWGANGAEGVGAWVGGAHLHPCGAVRADTKLHQTLLFLHLSA